MAGWNDKLIDYVNLTTSRIEIFAILFWSLIQHPSKKVYKAIYFNYENA